MNFELGKTYIVDVNERGIIPLTEFDRSQWYNKDYDDLDFLTDEEKIVVINSVLDRIEAEIEQNSYPIVHGVNNREKGMTLYGIMQIIDKYRAEADDLN